MGLKCSKEGISLTEFTRTILPMKLREGGVSVLITSARSNNFKRVKHDNGTISHPVMVLALSGQPFSLNDANLMGISMPAYSFEDGGLSEKKQIKAECFISINVVASGREVTGKTASFLECEPIHLDVNALPAFTQHCLRPNRWSPLEKRILGQSMQMLQSANALRLFCQIKAAISAHLESEIQAAKRHYQPLKAKQFEKRLREAKTKRFSQVLTFEGQYAWLQGIEKKWGLSLQAPITGILKKNPLRKFLSKQGKNTAVSPEAAIVVRRAFRSLLSTSNRFLTRCYLFSAIYPVQAQRAISREYGTYIGIHFKTDHPVLGQVPYPFSLYLLKEAEIVRTGGHRPWKLPQLGLLAEKRDGQGVGISQANRGHGTPRGDDGKTKHRHRRSPTRCGCDTQAVMHNRAELGEANLADCQSCQFLVVFVSARGRLLRQNVCTQKACYEERASAFRKKNKDCNPTQSLHGKAGKKSKRVVGSKAQSPIKMTAKDAPSRVKEFKRKRYDTFLKARFVKEGEAHLLRLAFIAMSDSTWSAYQPAREILEKLSGQKAAEPFSLAALASTRDLDKRPLMEALGELAGHVIEKLPLETVEQMIFVDLSQKPEARHVLTNS